MWEEQDSVCKGSIGDSEQVWLFLSPCFFSPNFPYCIWDLAYSDVDDFLTASCSSFISVAVIKKEHKKGDKGIYFSLQLQVTILHCGAVKEAGHITPTDNSTKKWTDTCSLTCAQLHFSTLPEEWCWPQWAGSSQIGALRCSVTDMPTGQSSVLSPSLRFSSPVILGCVKLETKAGHHTGFVPSV